MLIPVIGTQNLGKSTLIKDIIAKYPEFKTPEKDYRKIIEEKKLKLNREGDYRSQKILFDFMAEQTKELAEDKDNFYLLDRSIIDVVAYSMWHYNNRPKESGFTKKLLEEMEIDAIKLSKLYDFILFIPLDKNTHVKLEEDKFRDTNIEYREEIDKNFVRILRYISVFTGNLITIFGTREERLEQIKNDVIPQIRIYK